jgi:hypothetical protein
MNSLEDQIGDIVSNHADGDTLLDLYKKCSVFVEKTELAYALNKCLAYSVLYKAGSKYYKDIKLYEEELSRIKPNVASTVSKKVVKRPAPMGSLTSDTQIGQIAYAFYSYRDSDFLCVEDIVRILDLGFIASSAIDRLRKSNYIYERRLRDKICFRWSSKFQYPFSTVSDSDQAILVVQPNNFGDSDA